MLEDTAVFPQLSLSFVTTLIDLLIDCCPCTDCSCMMQQLSLLYQESYWSVHSSLKSIFHVTKECQSCLSIYLTMICQLHKLIQHWIVEWVQMMNCVGRGKKWLLPVGYYPNSSIKVLRKITKDLSESRWSQCQEYNVGTPQYKKC